jgi:hypothetical protein
VRNLQPQLWKKPVPLGYGQAIDAMTNVAAPLLAGFSITVIAAVAAASDKFRWPGAALCALALAVVLLVASLQFGFTARQHLYSAADVAAWWSQEDLAQPLRSERLQGEQHIDYTSWRQWSFKAIIAYNAGITALAIGVALVLVPPPSVHHFEAVLRWIAAAVAVAGAFGGIVWGAVPMVRRQLGSQLSRGDPHAD